MSSDTTLTIKTPKKLRDEAKKTAAKLGIPLTTVVNAMLGEFVREQSITFSVRPTPKPEKIAQWEKISAKMDKGHSKSFSNAEDLIEYLGLEK